MMLNRSVTIVSCAVIYLLIACLSAGCKKGILGDGTITIKGKLLQDCSGAPIAGKPLSFNLKIGSSKTGGWTETIGSDTTDQDGNFSVTGKNSGDGYLIVAYDYGGPQAYTYTSREIEGNNGSTIDLGIVYFKFDYSVNVKFLRQASNSGDTLFFGENSNQPAGSAIGSEIDGYVYHVSGQMNGSELPSTKEATWVWGLGMADYQNAIDSMRASGQSQIPRTPYERIFKVRVGVCKDDTSFVNLTL